MFLDGAVILRAVGETGDMKIVSIVEREKVVGEVGNGVFGEVVGEVSEANRARRGRGVGRGEGWENRGNGG